MAGRDLRALFSTNDPTLSASEAFTDRHGQWQLVQTALAEHLARIATPGFDVEDLEAPRGNVLVFHGVGGIGKTTLSRTLEAALSHSGQRPARWGEPSWPERPALLPVRIDLARAAGNDFERVLLTLRLALAAHLGRPLPAFDIALRRYWEHQHPGEPLEEYLARGGLGRPVRQGSAAAGAVRARRRRPGPDAARHGRRRRQPAHRRAHQGPAGAAPDREGAHAAARGSPTCWRPSRTSTPCRTTRTCSPGSSPSSPPTRPSCRSCCWTPSRTPGLVRTGTWSGCCSGWCG